ncbi:MAG: MarR family EPS-associated transcriptional regulator [Thermoanaerobaculia bacterium]
MDDDVRYHLLKLVEEQPDLTQREAAERLGMSLGKVNYCFRALVSKGWVKARNFRNSSRKTAYAYLLTPKGIEEKLRVTARFLDRKLGEYDALVEELHTLTSEVNAHRKAKGQPEVVFEAPASRTNGKGEPL